MCRAGVFGGKDVGMAGLSIALSCLSVLCGCVGPKSSGHAPNTSTGRNYSVEAVAPFGEQGERKPFVSESERFRLEGQSEGAISRGEHFNVEKVGK